MAISRSNPGVGGLSSAQRGAKRGKWKLQQGRLRAQELPRGIWRVEWGAWDIAQTLLSAGSRHYQHSLARINTTNRDNKKFPLRLKVRRLKLIVHEEDIINKKKTCDCPILTKEGKKLSAPPLSRVSICTTTSLRLHLD